MPIKKRGSLTFIIRHFPFLVGVIICIVGAAEGRGGARVGRVCKRTVPVTLDVARVQGNSVCTWLHVRYFNHLYLCRAFRYFIHLIISPLLHAWYGLYLHLWRYNTPVWYCLLASTNTTRVIPTVGIVVCTYYTRAGIKLNTIVTLTSVTVHHVDSSIWRKADLCHTVQLVDSN